MGGGKFGFGTGGEAQDSWGGGVELKGGNFRSEGSAGEKGVGLRSPFRDSPETAEGPEGHHRGLKGPKGAAGLRRQLLEEVVSKGCLCVSDMGLKKLQFLGSGREETGLLGLPVARECGRG